jgi:hypothetical protein
MGKSMSGKYIKSNMEMPPESSLRQNKRKLRKELSLEKITIIPCGLQKCKTMVMKHPFSQTGEITDFRSILSLLTKRHISRFCFSLSQYFIEKKRENIY